MFITPAECPPNSAENWLVMICTWLTVSSAKPADPRCGARCSVSHSRSCWCVDVGAEVPHVAAAHVQPVGAGAACDDIRVEGQKAEIVALGNGQRREVA